MATPIVTTDDGTYTYSTSLRRWVCTAGRIPGMSGGFHLNCCVHLTFGAELSAVALKEGFTREDFGFFTKPEKPEKSVKVKKLRTGKPGVRRSKVKNFEELFSL